MLWITSQRGFAAAVLKAKFKCISFANSAAAVVVDVCLSLMIPQGSAD